MKHAQRTVSCNNNSVLHYTKKQVTLNCLSSSDPSMYRNNVEFERSTEFMILHFLPLLQLPAVVCAQLYGSAIRTVPVDPDICRQNAYALG